MPYKQPSLVIWSDADFDRVAGMLKKGWSAARIGRAMGISRNSAVGRIYRNDRLRSLMKRPPKEAAMPRQWRMRVPPPKVKCRPAIVELPPPPMRFVPLHELKRGDCHWPCTPHNAARDQHLFCGAGTRRGERYCPYHCLINYAPRGAPH